MTYKCTKTLSEITQELDKLDERLADVAARQLNILERLEYVEDALEALTASDKPKKDR